MCPWITLWHNFTRMVPISLEGASCIVISRQPITQSILKLRPQTAVFSFVEIIQSEGERHLQQGGFVLNGYTIEFHLMIPAIEPLQEGQGQIEPCLLLGNLASAFALAGSCGNRVWAMVFKKIGGFGLRGFRHRSISLQVCDNLRRL